MASTSLEDIKPKTYHPDPLVKIEKENIVFFNGQKYKNVLVQLKEINPSKKWELKDILEKYEKAGGVYAIDGVVRNVRGVPADILNKILSQ